MAGPTSITSRTTADGTSPDCPPMAQSQPKAQQSRPDPASIRRDTCAAESPRPVRPSRPAPRVLYLTDTPHLGGTIRILEGWLLLARRERMLDPYVAIRPGSAFQQWLTANNMPHLCNPFPTPSKWAPWSALWHAYPLLRWIRRHAIQVIHCNEHNIYPFCVILRRLSGLPLVCHIRYQVSRDYCQWAFGRPSRQPDALLWPSQQQRSDCASAIAGIVPADRQYLVPLGVDPTIFGARAKERELTRATWGFAPHEIVMGQACALR